MGAVLDEGLSYLGVALGMPPAHFQAGLRRAILKGR
jgi:hypothetical protein